MKKLKRYILKPIATVVIIVMLAFWIVLSLATMGVCKEVEQIGQTDTLKTYTKIINYGKPNAEIYKCFIIRNGETQDTIKVLQGQGQAGRDIAVDDSLLTQLKVKIETDYKNDLKSFEEIRIKIIKEESYLELLNYLLIDEKKKTTN